jgi:hypothetical protein
MSTWSCKHALNDYCKLLSKECRPGYPGCVLYGRFVFADPNHPSNKKIESRAARRAEGGSSGPGDSEEG